MQLNDSAVSAANNSSFDGPRRAFVMSEIEIVGVAMTVALIALGAWVYSWPSPKS
jgi:hypothetical protein